MGAQLRFRSQVFEIEAGTTVREALQAAEIDPEWVIPTRDGEVISLDEPVEEGDRIRVVASISGG